MCLSLNSEVCVCSAAGSLMVSQCGQILIPTSCPAFLVVDFINRHAAEAKLIREQYLTCVSSNLLVACLAASKDAECDRFF